MKWGYEKEAKTGEEVERDKRSRALWEETRGGAIVGAEAGRGREEVGAEKGKQRRGKARNRGGASLQALNTTAMTL